MIAIIKSMHFLTTLSQNLPDTADRALLSIKSFIPLFKYHSLASTRFIGSSFTLQVMCSYVFMPIAYMMGIQWSDCFKVRNFFNYALDQHIA